MLVMIIYGGGVGNHIGGGDIIWYLVGELVHSKWKMYIEIEENIISLTSPCISLNLHSTVSPPLPHNRYMISS